MSRLKFHSISKLPIVAKFLFVLALIVSAIPNAKAGILLEPYLGYSMGSTSLTFGDGAASFSGQSVKIEGTGVGYGLRVGYSVPIFFVAIDYSMANLSGSIKEQPAGSTVTTGNTTVTSLGATAGANFLLLRPYVGYIFDDQAKDSSSTLSGTGFKLGLGFGFIPFVKLNLEYVMKTLTKSKDSAGTETSFSQSATYKSGSTSGFFLNLSVPLSL